ncbi:MAG TPA: hypothetical protein VJK48_03255 [Chlamydiales bacterium]|nr:hypothetical protein [Chlamydiales bacterium]
MIDFSFDFLRGNKGSSNNPDTAGDSSNGITSRISNFVIAAANDVSKSVRHGGIASIIYSERVAIQDEIYQYDMMID